MKWQIFKNRYTDILGHRPKSQVLRCIWPKRAQQRAKNMKKRIIIIIIISLSRPTAGQRTLQNFTTRSVALRFSSTQYFFRCHKFISPFCLWSSPGPFTQDRLPFGCQLCLSFIVHAAHLILIDLAVVITSRILLKMRKSV